MPQTCGPCIWPARNSCTDSDLDLSETPWVETPTWPYFSGNEYFEHRWPCGLTQLVKFRKLLGELRAFIQR